MDNMETALNKFLLSKKLAGLTEQSLTHYSEINRSFASDCLSEPVSAITVEYYQTYFLSLYDRHLSKATVSTKAAPNPVSLSHSCPILPSS